MIPESRAQTNASQICSRSLRLAFVPTSLCTQPLQPISGLTVASFSARPTRPTTQQNLPPSYPASSYSGPLQLVPWSNQQLIISSSPILYPQVKNTRSTHQPVGEPPKAEEQSISALPPKTPHANLGYPNHH
ncbi:hypothetical protein PGT21_022635 [Puccinia graminis f. sp. tritici]|uniref:Uncharacterized protein n=1 Tax=Puccinia graminis f. sp. tritici TaxID=56615 RepID=A0A5B0MVA4_PUCGR|nr:hypothetical protein PGT21_022635 [Puccinia graminis f. sp. tritici]